ncbi:MAG: site-2 protease family protein [Patescibacteria group bacterium]
MTTALILIFQLAVFIFSVMIHEISHGYTAEKLGDPTARLAGRLTLNPLRHLDPFGSFILPIGLYILTQGAFIFGWAKPVPYNPMLLKNPTIAAAKIAAAGPVSNLVIAAVFGILIRILGFINIPAFGSISLFFGLIVYINILLAVFNFVPIPPLDGSKVLVVFLPRTEKTVRAMAFLESYGFLFLLLFVFVFNGFSLILPLIDFMYGIFAGQPAVF